MYVTNSLVGPIHDMPNKIIDVHHLCLHVNDTHTAWFWFRDGGGRPSSVMSLGVTSVGGHSHGHPASPIGVGSSWEDIDPRTPEPLVVRGVGSGWSGLYGGPLRPFTCEPYPTQLVCRELRPEGLVAWCPGMLRYVWQVHNMTHKSPGSIYILWPRPTW